MMSTSDVASATPPDRLIVRGGSTLEGTIRIGGAKNSVLKLMAATLLAAGDQALGDGIEQIAAGGGRRVREHGHREACGQAAPAARRQ